jgi:hypothetical protein
MTNGGAHWELINSKKIYIYIYFLAIRKYIFYFCFIILSIKFKLSNFNQTITDILNAWRAGRWFYLSNILFIRTKSAYTDIYTNKNKENCTRIISSSNSLVRDDVLCKWHCDLCMLLMPRYIKCKTEGSYWLKNLNFYVYRTLKLISTLGIKI